ncbi:hypothetical protein GPA10_05265 [Streptomyces sp. p1417]|uniref:Uncharacterized protein n=1 Tax=Streptomyces typhae TaxID=2681492 RepID=A0A6L6WV19_9ACTN|nr:hypothetical protein [Streptomyces typhae]MVO84196.1 hypothetical protein [Streptomyces typhae]
MGYKAKRKTITLQFEPGHDLYGLEVQLRGMNIGQYLKFTGYDGGDGETVAGLIDRFGEHLVTWNLEDEDGTAIPATPGAVQEQDHDLILALANAWMDALAGVHDGDPLAESSPSGEPSLVESVPMEALSPSLAS